MEALGILLIIALGVGIIVGLYWAVIWAIVIVQIIVEIIIPLLPWIIVLGGGTLLWVSGHDNWGVIFAVSVFVVSWIWESWFPHSESSSSGSSYSWKHNKRAIYTKEGEVKGYIDKD